MKLFSNRDKKILILTGAVLLFVLSYFVIYKGQMKKVETLERQNKELEQTLAELRQIDSEKEIYQSETERMNQEMAGYCGQFPADIKEEDGIALAIALENQANMKISNISLGEKEALYSFIVSRETENVPAGEKVLSASLDTFSWTTDYEGLKRMLDYLNRGENRMTVDTMTVSFNGETGGLTGTTAINLYSMSGTKAEYKAPSIGGVSLGTDNIFRTMEGQ